MPEIWKDVVGYEGLYQVSNKGRVKRLERYQQSWRGIRKLPEKIMRLSNNRGYLKLSLYKEGVRKTPSVHQLVAKAFIPNPQKFTFINHKDENKKNNKVENLEWCTVKYNNNYGTRKDRAKTATQKPLLQFDLNGNLVKKWDSAKELKRVTGYDESYISKAARGKSKTAYGYKWAYKK